jgi:hypothetical protein
VVKVRDIIDLDALRKDRLERPWLYDEHAPEARQA